MAHVRCESGALSRFCRSAIDQVGVAVGDMNGLQTATEPLALARIERREAFSVSVP
jgi:hypothetical protein